LTSGADPNAADIRGLTSLMHAALGSASPSVAAALIGRRALVNARGRRGESAVLLAAVRRTPAMLNELLAHGANANQADSEGRTPLMAAASRGRAEAVEALLRRGADVGRRDAAGRTAFDLALENRYTQIAVVLKNSGTR
jgi:ankyrin repeat protein